MNQEQMLGVCVDTRHSISILAVVTAERSAEIGRILSHTRWHTQIVHSIREGAQTLRSFPFSVVLCEDRLLDGSWLDLLHEAGHLAIPPTMIVLSGILNDVLWEQVVTAGGYELLSFPLDPLEVYSLVPAAWRHAADSRQKTVDESPLGELVNAN